MSARWNLQRTNPHWGIHTTVVRAFAVCSPGGRRRDQPTALMVPSNTLLRVFPRLRRLLFGRTGRIDAVDFIVAETLRGGVIGPDCAAVGRDRQPTAGRRVDRRAQLTHAVDAIIA